MSNSQNMVELLYHRSPALYGKGDRVPPGNWGRMILGVGPRHNCFYREYLLEHIRATEFPDKPSRMKAAFAFENCGFAQSWNRGTNVAEYVFAVKLADPEAPLHRGDMNWIDAMGDFHSFSGVEECARHYWRGDERHPDTWEFVTAGELIVVDRLTAITENGVKC